MFCIFVVLYIYMYVLHVCNVWIMWPIVFVPFSWVVITSNSFCFKFCLISVLFSKICVPCRAKFHIHRCNTVTMRRYFLPHFQRYVLKTLRKVLIECNQYLLSRSKFVKKLLLLRERSFSWYSEKMKTVTLLWNNDSAVRTLKSVSESPLLKNSFCIS